MTQEEITCCFTGHRPEKLPWKLNEADSRCTDTKKWIAVQLKDLYENGYRHFYCGMAIGCDMYFAEEVISLRQKYPDVCLFGAVPCREQSGSWNKKQRLMYAELIEQCDEIKLISESYNRMCMNARNRFMVEHSSVLLACFNGTPGGTMNTIHYANKKGLSVRILDISELIRDPSREVPDLQII